MKYIKKLNDVVFSSLSQEEANELQEESLRTIQGHAWLVMVPVFFVLCLIGSFAYNDIPTIYLFYWFIIFVNYTFFRVYFFRRYLTDTSISIVKRLHIATLFPFLNACLIASSLLLFPYLSVSEKAIQTLLLLGLTSGSVATSSEYKPHYIAFNLPVVGGLIYAWISMGQEGNSSWQNIALIIGILIYFLINHSLFNRSFNFYAKAIRIKNQQIKLNQKLNQAYEEVKNASESKTRFLASASHDLRQPIHTLQLLSAALSMQKINGNGNKIAQQIDDALDNLASQMDGLLDISKLDAGIVQKVEKATDLVPLCERLAKEFEAESTSKGLEFKHFLSVKSAYTLTDTEQLERVLRNLLTNAVKYTHEGLINLHLNDKQEYWELQISDTGVGIPEEEKVRIFEEFYQVSNPERDHQKGLGLGLAIVKRLTKLLDISIDFESKVNHGTTFSIRLPKYEFIESEVPQKHKGKPVNAFLLSSIKVLCVDDDLAIRNAMKELFSKSLGCEAYICRDIAEVREILQSCKPDIMLADFRLEGHQTGIEAIATAREIIPNLPALLISGDTAPERLKQAEQVGIKLLHKPLKPNRIKSEIRQLLESSQ